MSPEPIHLRRAPRPGLLRALVVVAVVAIAMPAAADAASSKSARVCALRATLFESPGGAVTGIVHRGDVLFVLIGSARAPWWRVQTTFGTRGWLRRATLCGRTT